MRCEALLVAIYSISQTPLGITNVCCLMDQHRYSGFHIFLSLILIYDACTIYYLVFKAVMLLVSYMLFVCMYVFFQTIKHMKQKSYTPDHPPCGTGIVYYGHWMLQPAEHWLLLLLSVLLLFLLEGGKDRKSSCDNGKVENWEAHKPPVVHQQKIILISLSISRKVWCIIYVNQ